MNDLPHGLPAPIILWSLRDQCLKTPDALAIETQDDRWTYRRLDRVTDLIAQRLIRDGLGSGECVGLCVDRSAEAIAAMIGVMKAGGVFVPLDPEYPVDRLAYMVADSDARRIVGHAAYADVIGSKLAARASWTDADEICRDADGGVAIDEDSLSQRLQAVAPESLAYVMYTSGSTGKPKGVEISHLALAVYCDADIDCYRLSDQDRTLQFSTLCFDIAIEEIFPPLLCGGCVVVRPRERSADRNELSSIIDRQGVTAVHLATAYWHQWVDLMVATGARIPRSLRLLIATGEKVSVEHYRRWRSICDHDVLWCNAYGPTETTVTATVYIPDDDYVCDPMPIGRPLKHYSAAILDDEYRAVENGQTGNLFIGGPALAKGYHNRDDLNSRAFVNVPIDGVPQRLYRTGDLARWLPDGNIEFAGRIDHQIKLGSYRIEPGEIDAVLNQAPGVLESLVTYEEHEGQKFLIAYVAVSEPELNVSELSEFLRQRLPAYMVPTRYVFLESLPKTINGKVDRAALPDASLAVSPGSDRFIAPQNELQRRLAQLWQEVLHVPQIGIDDDFFLLGGSSLLVTQVVSKLTSELQIELPVRDFFANPTIATLAAHLRSITNESSPSDAGASDDESRRLRERLPLAETFFFTSNHAELYASEYRSRTGTTRSAVLLCYPLGHEYTRAYRNVQQLAVALSQNGHHVLRFDYFGTGNSDGHCEQIDSQTLIGNLVDARHTLAARAQTDAIDVVGLRLGASIAANADRNLFRRVILWDPVVDGASMLERFDAFHDEQLIGMSRFNEIRYRSEVDQAYGHAMTVSKRASLAEMELPDCRSSDWVVCTRGALSSSQETAWYQRQSNRVEVGDEICWDDVSLVESAFSSPESFRAILAILQQHKP